MNEKLKISVVKKVDSLIVAGATYNPVISLSIPNAITGKYVHAVEVRVYDSETSGTQRPNYSVITGIITANGTSNYIGNLAVDRTAVFHQSIFNVTSGSIKVRSDVTTWSVGITIVIEVTWFYSDEAGLFVPSQVMQSLI